MLEVERRDDVDLLWLDRPPVNAADLDSLTELADAVDSIAPSPTVLSC